MKTKTTKIAGIHKVVMGKDGRIVIPAAVRKAMDIKIGDTLVIEHDDKAVHVSTLRTKLAEFQELIRKHNKENISLVDDFIKSKRRGEYD